MVRTLLIRGVLAAMASSLLSTTISAQTQSFTVDELQFNSGAAGAVITFDTEATIEVTEDTANRSLNITLPTTIRLKCGAQSSPDVCVLLAEGGTVDPNQDTDNDGVPDSTPDLCPDTPPNTTVDATGCTVVISNPNEYCDGVNTTTTSCSNNTTHDEFYQSSAEYLVEIPPGKILAVPFTTVDSTTAYGSLTHTTDAAQGSYVFKSWFSTIPGASTTSSDTLCVYNRAPETPIEWQQDGTSPGCNLGQTGRVLYLNYQPNVCDFSGAEPDCTLPYNSTFIIRITRNVFSS